MKLELIKPNRGQQGKLNVSDEKDSGDIRFTENQTLLISKK